MLNNLNMRTDIQLFFILVSYAITVCVGLIFN